MKKHKHKHDAATPHKDSPAPAKSEAPDPKKKLGRKEYQSELYKLQAEMVHMQDWVKAEGERVVVVFEGRDAAGKGGVIKEITDRVSPRVFRVVALPAPSEIERSQLYMQRYLRHFPSAGEIVLFDRSWYNRAGVERVMGFCTHEEYERFLVYCPFFERLIVESGIRLFKYWLEVSQEEQARRFNARINDPRKTWKLSPMDLEAHRRWYDYSRARDAMFRTTDTEYAPWHLADFNNKRRGRLNLMTHLLDNIPYEREPIERVKLPPRQDPEGYVEPAARYRRVPNRY